MTSPQRFLIRMSLFLVLVAAAAGLLFPALRSAFGVNIALNGLILGVLLLGIIYNFRQVVQLYPEIAWLERYRRSPIVHRHSVCPDGGLMVMTCWR